MVTALDRITREQYHWEMFAEKCHQGGKEIICLDDPSLDIHSPEGRLIAYVKATQAMPYRLAVSKKRKGQTESFRQSELWGGGAWPFGYRPVPMTMDDGKVRYKLFQDPVTSKLVREAYERIVNQGDSMGKICRDWNARGVLTSKDYQRAVNVTEKKAGAKTEVKGSIWASSALRAILRKPTLKGIAMHKGKPLLKKGMPVRWAEPILKDDEYDILQKILTEFRESKSGVRRNSDPTSGLFPASGPSAPLAVDQPSTGPTAPLELTLEQKAWFLGGNDPQSWPWADIPYAQAEDAYRSHTGQTAA